MMIFFLCAKSERVLLWFTYKRTNQLANLYLKNSKCWAIKIWCQVDIHEKNEPDQQYTMTDSSQF